MSIKRNSTFPKASEPDPHHQLQFSDILSTLDSGVVGVFYCPTSTLFLVYFVENNWQVFGVLLFIRFILQQLLLKSVEKLSNVSISEVWVQVLSTIFVLYEFFEWERSLCAGALFSAGLNV